MKNARKMFLILFLISLSTLFVACNISNNESKQSYRVEYTADWGGHIEGAALQSVKEGEDASTVSAVADEGYVFFKWSDESTDPVRTDKNITKDVVYSAYFQLDVTYYSVRYRAGEGGEISGVSEQTVAQYGNASAVEAVAKPGYKFLGWSDGKTEAARRDTYILADIDVEARFEFLFEGGTGSETDPLIIANKQQFLNMREWRGSHYKLQNDLSFVGENYQPVFDVAAPFDGVFDGGGHSITDVTITVPGECPSIFGAIGENGEVSNLNISAFIIDINNIYNIDTIYIGSVAGVSQGNLRDIHIVGTISITNVGESHVFAGGLAGKAARSVEHCSANLDYRLKNIVSEESSTKNISRFGGLLGIEAGDGVKHCHATVNYVYGGISGDLYLGGLLGKVDVERNCPIENCAVNIEASGDMSDDSSVYVAGISTYVFHQAEICISGCDINCAISSSTCASGIVLDYYFDGGINNCTVLGNIIADELAMGLMEFCSNVDITQCRVDCNIQAAEVYGFAKRPSQTNLNKCSAKGEFAGSMYAFGLCGIMSDCLLELSYSDCKLSGQNAAGICQALIRSSIVNCYSVSDILVVGDAIKRVSGFVWGGLENSAITNCYFCGNITGEVVYNDANYISAFFMGGQNVTLTNCHIFNIKNDVVNKAPIYMDAPSTRDIILNRIYYYDTPEEMYSIAEKLDETNAVKVWEQPENGLPYLK